MAYLHRFQRLRQMRTTTLTSPRLRSRLRRPCRRSSRPQMCHISRSMSKLVHPNSKPAEPARSAKYPTARQKMICPLPKSCQKVATPIANLVALRCALNAIRRYAVLGNSRISQADVLSTCSSLSLDIRILILRFLADCFAVHATKSSVQASSQRTKRSLRRLLLPLRKRRGP